MQPNFSSPYPATATDFSPFNKSTSKPDNMLLDYFHYDQNLVDVYKFLRESDWNHKVVPVTVFVSILLIVGTVGNSLVIAVFMRTSPALSNSSTNAGSLRSKVLITALAVADLLLCVIAMPGQIARVWYLPWKWDWLCKIWELLRHAVLPVSAVILVAIAYDRYCLICHPTRPYCHKGYKRNLWIMLGSACVVGVLFGIPPMLGVGVYQAVDETSGEVEYLGLCEVNGLILSQPALEIYWHILVAFFWLVLISLLIMYSAILLSVWRQAKQWNRRTSTKIFPTNASPKASGQTSQKNNTVKGSPLLAKSDAVSKYEEGGENGNAFGTRAPSAQMSGRGSGTKCVKKNAGYDRPCVSDFENTGRHYQNSTRRKTNPSENGHEKEEAGLFFIKMADLAQLNPRTSSFYVKRTETVEVFLSTPKMSNFGADEETAQKSHDATGGVGKRSKFRCQREKTYMRVNSCPDGLLLAEKSSPVSEMNDPLTPAQINCTSQNFEFEENALNEFHPNVEKNLLKTVSFSGLNNSSDMFNHDSPGGPCWPRPTGTSRTNRVNQAAGYESCSPSIPHQNLCSITAPRDGSGKQIRPLEISRQCWNPHCSKKSSPRGFNPHDHTPPSTQLAAGWCAHERVKACTLNPTSVQSCDECIHSSKFVQHQNPCAVQCQNQHNPTDNSIQVTVPSTQTRGGHSGAERVNTAIPYSTDLQNCNPSKSTARIFESQDPYVPTVSSIQNHHLCSPQEPSASMNEDRNRTKQANDSPQNEQTNRLSVTQRPLCRAHVKTAMVFFLVTATFLLSYIPTFLMIMDLVPDQPVLFYSYFIHAAVNPLLYSATNKNFRTGVKKLFECGP